MEKYVFEARMEVRDYECDIEGPLSSPSPPAFNLFQHHSLFK